MNIYLWAGCFICFFVMDWMTTVLLLSMADREMESAARPQGTEAVQDDSHENSALNQKPKSITP